MISIWTLILIVAILSSTILCFAIFITEYNNLNCGFLNRMYYSNLFYIQMASTICIWVAIAVKNGIITL